MKDALEPLRVTYDAEANAAYIYFVPEIEAGGIARTVPLGGGEHPWMVNTDVGADGQILGPEVLDAHCLLPAALIGT
ncbi:DUF2283 domain-containing protein [Nocardioides rotundus]|uniref:DUF2283 domain-containing protein n=1 Tax=Nocardioides rotundus TaxID=1774216 RepID=UPI001CBDC7DC|nr:DUF2283 domain-containing protein [Nocardioides rotundus]UAL29581.1 DUF2283 domain-containing protein [Nocardioides rotundus]